jgi:uncharacterized delta-60 repeat protein
MLMLLLLLMFTLNCVAQPGSLDPGFGVGGKVTTDIAGFRDVASSIAVQTDGKILISAGSNNGTNNDFCVVRYNSDGTVDNTFASSGKYVTDFQGFDDGASSLIIQTDGKIVLSGGATSNLSSDFALVRLLTDGSLDMAFGSGGKVVTDFYGGNDGIRSMAIQNDGKILTGGHIATGNPNYTDFALARYNSNGSLDTMFDNDGKVSTSFVGMNDFIQSIAIQSDGKIIVAGWGSDGIINVFALCRYNSNGSLDSTFGINGKVTTDFPSADDWDWANCLALQADDGIVVGGYTSQNGTTNFALARYLADGSLDYNFDFDGKVITPFGSSLASVQAMAVQPDDKIVVGVMVNNTPNRDFVLARYNYDGSLDTSFDSDGKVITDFNNSNDVINSVVLQNDGKIIAAGYSNDDLAIARYNGASAIGIPGVTKENFVVVYPSLIQSNFKITSVDYIQSVKIYNMLGDAIIEVEINNVDSEIDVSQIGSGVYLLEVNSVAGKIFKKIVKE